MNRKRVALISAVGVAALGILAMTRLMAADALDTAFPYRGFLTQAGVPARGAFDFEFRLYDEPEGGGPIVTITRDDVAINGGAFAVELDFGRDLTSGDPCFLEISVRGDGQTGGPFVLQPRLPMGPALQAWEYPFALYAAGTSGASVLSEGASVTREDAVVPEAGAGSWIGIVNGTTSADAEYCVVCGGINNEADGENYAFIGGGDSSTASGEYSTVSGGYSNTASDYSATVGGGYHNTASGYSATIGGGHLNVADSPYCSVGGGHGAAATGYASSISGGYSNTASGQYSSVGGGRNSTAGGEDSSVAGGRENASNGEGSAVAGGNSNRAGGNYAAVAGGSGNRAGGNLAAVAGGKDNSAAGHYSFAAGRHAQALHNGAFVWADNAGAPFASEQAGQFNVRAYGGVRLFSDAAATTGVKLPIGSGSWVSMSDRDAKKDIEPVEGREVLETLADVPVSTWRYKAQDGNVRHIGPMAQDLHAAFGCGESDTTISTVDADGIALAAIQGLYQVVQEKDARIEALERDKDAEIAELKARLEALETLLGLDGR